MEPSEQKDVPPDFSDLDNLHKFVSSFLGRVEKVEREVNLDNNIGAMPHDDTKSKMTELRDMVIDVENRIQDASDDLAQPENLNKHVNVFHNYYTWVNREITRITDHLGEHGYQPLDEHASLPSDMHQIWDEGLNTQNDENESNDGNSEGGTRQQLSEPTAFQQDDGHISMEDEETAIDTRDMSFDVSAERREGEGIKPPQTPKNSAETPVTAKFVTVHTLSPQQDYEQKITEFKAFFQEKPDESMTCGNSTSFQSSNSEFMYNTSPNKPGFGTTSLDKLNGSWMATGKELITEKSHEEQPLTPYSNTRNDWDKTDVSRATFPPGGGSSLEEPIALCTEQEYEQLLRGKIQLNLKEVNAMIMSLNEVQKKNPGEPLDLSAGDNEMKVLNLLDRIKFDCKGTKMGYFPISTTS